MNYIPYKFRDMCLADGYRKEIKLAEGEYIVVTVE